MLDNQPQTYYLDDPYLRDVQQLQREFDALVSREIQELSHLEDWIEQEQRLLRRVQEAMTGHKIDFYRDTASAAKHDIHMYDQTVIQPLLMTYAAKLDKKFLACPLTEKLDNRRYKRMKTVRQSKSALFREENIPLIVREKQLGVKYSEVKGGISIAWAGQRRSYSYVQAQLDNPDRAVREQAWRALAKARRSVKPEMDAMMSELIAIRHQIALNAGFKNYRDYMFVSKNREYSLQDCSNLHTSALQLIVPSWNRLSSVLQSDLGVDRWRPWDNTTRLLHQSPFSTVTELMDGVQKMFGKTDAYFEEQFQLMRQTGLLDVEWRPGKHSGGFMDPLPATQNAFVFTNFGPSFNAIIALIHEMGHAINTYLNRDFDEQNWRDEVTELFSHSMELLLLDKLDVFYPNSSEFRSARREEVRRALGLLLGPVTRDVFETWMYTHPTHTVEERDQCFLEISKQYKESPVDLAGLESDMSTSWIDTSHYFLYPFYSIEYSISVLGAFQLLQLYRQNPQLAVALYKQGASANINLSIAEIYQATGITFDFSAPALQKAAEFVEQLINELQ
ncbi:M3 family oligoendopeptidase [Alicyclobacillus ferrooxydans]|uniref:Peptidase M3 n=1 Tax=Alicyclobacillus ferrooxydans TaxID=471514 RepID=A0A0P9EJD5_9BACL|nr:M3 family oligoendopeptidase [Alicyclobacillus ferrooxydans]KPV43067.1 peptidase M3 [Alicyclobacillus ferrooxydans]